MKRIGVLLTSLTLLFTVYLYSSSKNYEGIKVKKFSLSNVRLLENSVFYRAQELNKKILLSYNPDRLLAKFRKEAGLEPKAEHYGGWEAEGIAGHSLGHFLSALSLMFASTGDPCFRKKVDYIVDELDLCQKTNKTGYVMCIPRGKELFKEISEGKIETERFNLNGCWVPIYTLHKEMAGLRDAFRFCGNKKALEIEVGLANWFYTIIGHLDDEQMQKLMFCEHGGIMEVLLDLWRDTLEPRYLQMAKKFWHKEIMDSILSGKDILPGYHANTQIPKFIGLAKLYELTGDERGRIAAEFFWDRVVNHHSYVNGGHSLNEYFGPPDSLSDRLDANTAETCNVYNMLKLTEHLFCWKPDAKYFDFYERALLNHILSSQNPIDGRVVYYLSLEMGGYKVFQDPEWFTCCIGTGMENHSKYGENIYFHTDDELFINLFIASELKWNEKGLTLFQETKFPEEDSVILKFKMENPSIFSLYIRYPWWAKGGCELNINGHPYPVTSVPSSYIKILRKWKDGDEIFLRFPMTLHLESMPDNQDRIAIMYGPLLLAGILGPIDDPEAEDDLYVPFLLTNEKNINNWLIPVNGKTNTFRLSGVGKPRDIELKPFYLVHDCRYTVYWDRGNENEWKEREEKYKEKIKQKIELEKRTIDFVIPGNKKSEMLHKIKTENSEEGETKRKKYRIARDGGWFSYEFKVAKIKPICLRVTYGHLRKDSFLEIYIEDIKLTEKIIKGYDSVGFDYFEYPIPDELTKGKRSVRIKISSRKTETSPRILDLRIVKKESK